MLRRNTIANYVGTGWTALMSVAFVPIYIEYLGIEAYGVIGFFVLLNAWLALLDMGMTPTMNREMARCTAGTHTPESIRDLLRSLEAPAVTIALLIAGAMFLAAPVIATSWMQASTLGGDTIAQALSVMGLVMGLRFLEGIYRGSILGLQRHILLNAIEVAISTFRAAGAVAVLTFWAPTLHAFFMWQGAVSLVSLLVMVAATYTSLPRAQRVGRFSFTALSEVWRFAGGMLGVTFLSLLLMQVDKILLSTMLPLAEFGVYTLAAAVTAVLYKLAAPIGTAFFPRLSQLHATGDNVEFVRTFHRGAQLVSVSMGSAAIFLILFSEPLLRLWTGNPELAHSAAPLVSILALGNLLNGLMHMPYFAQISHGWTSLTLRINACAVFVIVPAVLIVTPVWGAVGAAWIWASLNAFYIFVGAQLMFRHIMQGEKLQWYLEDLIYPLAMTSIVAIVVRYNFTDNKSALVQLAQLFVSSLIIVTVAGLSAKIVRTEVLKVIAKTRVLGARR